MPEPDPAPHPSERAVPLVLAALMVVALIPYRIILDLYPIGPDVPLWVHDMEPSDPNWFHNVFLTHHFIAYRPVTALTFTLDGFLPPPYGMRVTDLFFHAVSGLTLYAAFRAVAPRVSRWWGVVAAAAFWFSPLAELVVPFVTRRSYTVSAAFAFAAVAATFRGLRADHAPMVALGAATFAASALSNESGFVLAPVLLAVAASWGHAPRRTAVHLAPLAVAVVGALALRHVVMAGSPSGYPDGVNLVSVVVKGEATFIKRAPLTTIFAYAWRGGVFPDDLRGDPMFVFAFGADRWIAAAFAVWTAWFCARRAKARDKLPVFLAFWAFGYPLLAVVGHVWFPRQSYAMVGVVAMFVAWAAAVTWSSPRGWVRAVDIAVLVLIFATRVQRATPVRGIERRLLRDQVIGTRTVEQAVRLAREHQVRGQVLLGVNLDWRNADSAARWVDRLLGDDVDVVLATDIVVPENPRIRQTLTRDPDGRFAPLPHAQWVDDPASSRGHRYPMLPESLVSSTHPQTWIVDDTRVVRIDDGVQAEEWAATLPEWGDP